MTTKEFIHSVTAAIVQINKLRSQPNPKILFKCRIKKLEEGSSHEYIRDQFYLQAAILKAYLNLVLKDYSTTS